MCEDAISRFRGWAGWNEVPAPVLNGRGGWTDICHVLTEDLARSPMFPRPRIEQIYRQPEYPARVTEIQMVCHHGTHVDAPNHFLADGPSFDQVPLDRLYGGGVVMHLDAQPRQAIGAEMLAAADPGIMPGDILLIDSGWAGRVNGPDYEDHPYLTGDAASWLVERGIKMLGVDFSTPDMGAGTRPPAFDFPVHKALLSRGILIVEHITNIAPFAGKRIECCFFALAIAGADGGPVRAVARLAEPEEL